jgi:RND family efflux transporter MFP subunit
VNRIGRAAPLVALLAIFPCSCRVQTSSPPPETKSVKATVVKAAYIPDEVSSFGSLSFSMKIDISATQDAVLGEMPYREADRVQAGAVVALLRNPQIGLSVGKAENSVTHAEASIALAEARLYEGRLAVESRLLDIEKNRLEMEQAKRELAESERKQADQDTLFLAGGVPEETIRAGRFSIASRKESITLMEKEQEIRLIGLRDEDLLGRGVAVPSESSERLHAIVNLATSTLLAEKSAAESNRDAAKKELESARVALNELVLISPVDGVIAARYMEVGERVKRDDKIMTIMDIGSLYAVVPIRELDAVRLVAGMAATVHVDAAAASFAGVLDSVSPMADSQSGAFTVRVSLQDAKGILKPGMFARVSILAGAPRRVITVPEGAVVDRAGDSGFVFVLAGGAVHMQKVTLGEMTGSGRVVLHGVSEGDVAIDKPEPGLKEGDFVSVSK